MALIKCPECGKEMSDRAVSCPQCGTPINEIKAKLGMPINNSCKNEGTATSTSQQKKESKRVPVWAGVLMIIGTLLLVCVIVKLFIFKPSRTDIPQQSVDSIQEPVSEAQCTDAVVEADDGITSLSGEWFMAHYATFHIALTHDGHCMIEEDGTLIEGTYTLKDSVIVLLFYPPDETRIKGYIEEHNGEIYLGFNDFALLGTSFYEGGFAWFVPTDETTTTVNAGYEISQSKHTTSVSTTGREESRTINGIWSFQSIDPSTYDIWEYSLVFSGNQFKFKTESSGGRASEGRWLDYKITGNDIYIDGERRYTIEPDGSIKRIQDGQIFTK